jgi:hypothetical protein
MKNHPNTSYSGHRNLRYRSPSPSGQTTEGNLYTREIGYGVCCRLQGFGLAHEIDVQTRELPLRTIAFAYRQRGSSCYDFSEQT